MSSAVDDAADAIERAWHEGLRPDPLLTVSQWADQHRMLSAKASSEPGRWRTGRTPYLRDIMDALSTHSPIERVVFMKGAQIGAPLAIDTAIPTPNGWTTMGALEIGDYVFGAGGLPCKVTGVSEVMHGHECYEVVFDDGSTVIADAAHRWPVLQFTGKTRTRRTVTTAQMVGRERSDTNKYWRFCIDVCAPVELPPRELPIDPYVLGLWLGDGNCWMNHITMHEDDEEIIEHIRRCGVDAIWRRPKWSKGKAANIVLDPTYRVLGDDGRAAASCATSPFSVHLRRLDLVNNKHIPAAYLRASRTQRLALIQGLMDSDCCISLDGKRCEFGNADPKLVDGMVELLRSLGYKPTVYRRAAKRSTFTRVGEAPYACTSKESGRVCWSAYREEPMFRLSRKVARMRPVETGRTYVTRRRYVHAVRPVASVPVRCISVDAADHLYLCGKGWIPTHNTESGSNWIGYVIHHAPGPMMAVWPTVEMAKRNSKQRIDPLIEESPVLAQLIAPARSRDAGNTILAKEFRGGVLVMTGANSAVGLRSMPVRYLFLDEVDGYPRDVEGEGDAIALAEARTRTFARRKIFIVSTPTIANASAIEREYLASDQRRYFVPCPHCAGLQWLRFEQLQWPKGSPQLAAYVCEHCTQPIAEHYKAQMLAAGRWQPTNPDYVGRTAGFHLSSLYSPLGWRSWAEIAQAWEAAVDKESGSSAAIKTFKNTELGETWIEDGDAPEWEQLAARGEDYPIGTIPADGLLLTAGADVQTDRIEVSVWAYGRGKTSWLVEHRVLMGATNHSAVWQELMAWLGETWTHASGVELRLSRLAVDAGYATQEVYAFVRACRDPRVIATKGVPRGAALIGTPTAVDVSINGKKLKRGAKVYAVAVGIAKLELYANLRKTPVVDADTGLITYPAGYVHLPKVDTEYLQQLCSEQLVTRRDRNGYAKREWVKHRPRNEALDCAVLARAAATQCGLDRFEERHWLALESQLSVHPGQPPPLRLPAAAASTQATHRGGLLVSVTTPPQQQRQPQRVRPPRARVIRSRWLE